VITKRVAPPIHAGNRRRVIVVATWAVVERSV
jgi:hypothetical protein